MNNLPIRSTETDYVVPIDVSLIFSTTGVYFSFNNFENIQMPAEHDGFAYTLDFSDIVRSVRHEGNYSDLSDLYVALGQSMELVTRIKWLIKRELEKKTEDEII